MKQEAIMNIFEISFLVGCSMSLALSIIIPFRIKVKTSG